MHDVVRDFEAINARVTPDGVPEPWSDTTLEENLVDLGWHQKEFELRRSFAYTVVAPDESKVLGCVYLYPSDEADVDVRMWVRAEAYAEGLDPVLESAVRTWIEATWPFQTAVWPDRERRIDVDEVRAASRRRSNRETSGGAAAKPPASLKDEQ